MTPTSKFKIYSDYRTSSENIDDLALSIKSDGLYQPIVVKPEGDEYEIVAGRRRFRAMAEYLQWENLIGGEHFIVKEGTDALVAQFQENFNREDFTPTEIAKLIKDIHDRKVEEHGPAIRGQEGGWGMEDTGDMIGRGKAFVSKMLSIHRNEEEVRDQETTVGALSVIDRKKKKDFHDKVKKATYERRTKEVSPDLDELLDNVKVTQAETYLSQCDDEIFDMVLTDPPYAINYDELSKGQDSSYYYKDDPEEIKTILEYCVPEYYRVLKSGCYCVIWTAFEHYQYLFDLMRESSFFMPRVPLFWIKTHSTGMSIRPDKTLGSRVEVALYGWKGDAELAQSGKGNAFHADVVRGASRIHPTQKPDALYEQLLSIFTYKNAKVLDTFAGSLALLRACYKTGRDFYGCDSEEEYVIDAVNHTREWSRNDTASFTDA